MLGRLLLLAKGELRVALETFSYAWLGLTAALELYCLCDSPRLHGAADLAMLLTFGSVICAFYAFWPACAVTACRVVHRILGWGVYVGALLVALGVGLTLLISRHWLAVLVLETFDGAGSLGPCGGHAGGPAALLALLCLVGAVVASPASLWALFKLFLALGVAVVVGSVPGVLLWLALLLRRAARLAPALISR